MAGRRKGHLLSGHSNRGTTCNTEGYILPRWKEISPEDLAGKSGKVKIRFDYTNTTSYTETVNGEKQTVSVPFAAITGLVLGDGFENIEVTNGKAEVSDSSSVVLGYALPGLKNSLGIKDKDLDGDVNIPEYMEMTADVENFSMPAAMTFVVNASDYVSTDGIDTSDLDDMINDLRMPQHSFRMAQRHWQRVLTHWLTDFQHCRASSAHSHQELAHCRVDLRHILMVLVH